MLPSTEFAPATLIADTAGRVDMRFDTRLRHTLLIISMVKPHACLSVDDDDDFDRIFPPAAGLPI